MIDNRESVPPAGISKLELKDFLQNVPFNKGTKREMWQPEQYKALVAAFTNLQFEIDSKVQSVSALVVANENGWSVDRTVSKENGKKERLTIYGTKPGEAKIVSIDYQDVGMEPNKLKGITITKITEDPTFQNDWEISLWGVGTEKLGLVFRDKRSVTFNQHLKRPDGSWANRNYTIPIIRGSIGGQASYHFAAIVDKTVELLKNVKPIPQPSPVIL